MRSPRAVNRTHTRCTPIHAHHSKGQRLSSLRALHKAIRHSLVNQDAYAEKASLIFGQLDLKLAEFMKKAELSEEERVEKERRVALKKAEKDAQLKAKKEAEQRRKQEKLERKQAEAATKQTIDPKLEAATYVPQTVVVEESKPLKKEETKKNKKTEKKPVETPVEVKEEPIVKIHAPSPVESKPEEKVDKKSKKDKKEKKKSESEKLIDEVKLFEVTATPKNTPIDTPKEAPATPAEYDLEPQPQHQVDLSKPVHEEKKSKKNKKEKKQSESKAEPEEVNYEQVKAPVEEPVIEKVEQVKQEATAEVNGVHETESVKNLPDLVEGEEEKAPFIIDEKEGEGNLGKIGKENDDFEIGVDERPIESRFKETLQNAGVAPVKHWETQNEGNVEEEPKEGLLTTLADTVTGIWDSVTAGILGGNEKDAPKAEATPDIWEEFTSGKPLFKDETEETITAKHLAPEEIVEKQAEQIPDIWEEFTSGKPLFKDNDEEKPIVAKTEQAENVSSAQVEPTPDIWEEFTSGKPLFKDETEETITAKHLAPEEIVEKQAEQIPDIWEEFTSGKPLFKDNDEEKPIVAKTEQAENVSSAQVEPTPDIWEEFTSGKPLFKDETEETITAKHLAPEEIVEKQAEQTPDIWEEFTSGKPLFKDNDEEKPIVAKTEQAENVSSAQVEPTPDIWEEFTSGKPLFKEDVKEPEEVKAVEEQTESQNKKSKNKKNKDKRSKNASESTKEPEVVQAEVSPVVESPKIEESEVKEEKKNGKNKKKDRKSKKSESEVPFDQVEKGLLRTELKDSPSEMSTASMVVNIPLNEDQEKFNATQPEIEQQEVSQEIQPEEETQFVAFENKKNKKKDKRSKKESEQEVSESNQATNEPAVGIWEEFASGKPVFKDEVEIEKDPIADEIGSEPQVVADQPVDIWEEFASGKPLFKDETEVEKMEEKVTETSESQPVDIWEEFTSGKPLFKDESFSEKKFDESPAQPAQPEAEPHEVTYGAIPLTETKKNNKKNKKKEKKTSESHEEPSAVDKTESSEYELALEKDIFQKLKPADLRKSKSKSPEPESVYVWDGLVSGVPIIKAVTSPTSSPKKVSTPVVQEAESEHKEGLLSSLAETVTGIWEDLTSGKPLFGDNEKAEEKVEPAAESTPEEFTSGKPLFKEVDERKPAVPEAVEQKSESAPVETQNKKSKNKKNKGKRSTNPSESAKEVEQSEAKASEPATEPTPDIWEEFTSGKPLFKDELPDIAVSDAPIVVEELKKVELKPEPIIEPTPDIWEEFTSGKPLFKDEAEVEKPVSEPVQEAEPTPDIWEEFTSGKPLFKDESVPIPTKELESSISQSSPNPHTSPPKEDPVKDKKSKKDKKNKKTSESEAKVEVIPEPVTVEKVEDPVEHKEPSKKDKKKNKKNSESEPKAEPVEAKIEVIEAPKAERVEEPVSIEIEEKESKKDKKKNKKEKKTSESQSQFSPDSGVAIEQDPPLVSPANLGHFAEMENAEVKISAPPSNIENIDIWEEFASGKPLFKEVEEEKPQTSEDIANFPIGHWETPTLQLSATEIWGEGGKKKKHKEEPAFVPRPSYNTWDEPIKHEKELEKTINVPAPEAPKDIWEEFTSGKPIFREDNKEGTLVKQVSIEDAIRVPEPDAPIDIWEEFTSGKPIFKNEDDISEDLLKKAEAAIEASRKIWAEDQQASGSADIWEEFTSGKPLFKDESIAAQKHIDVEPEAKKVTATVTKTEDGYNAIVTEDEPEQRATNVHRAEHITLNVVYAGDGKDEEEPEPEPTPAPPKQDTKESKSKKKDKKHKKSESENNVEAEPVKENGHPVETAPIVKEKKEEAAELKYDGPATQTADTKSKDKKDNKKKNKKGKTNSESEKVEKKKSPSPVKEVPLPEKPVVVAIPEPTKAEPIATPSPTNNGSSKNKKKNKGKHGKDIDSPVAVEEKQSPVSSGKFDPVEEASHQHVEDLKSAQPVEVKINGINGNVADDHGFEEQKGKKGRKKNKSRSSESHELNGKLENAQELNYNNDDVNKMGIESTSEQLGETAVSPVQVNEVTSSEATEGNQRVYRENIKAAYDIDSSADPTAHPTQFAIQVQKLVESTLAASELKHADPNTKYSVQAQLLRLKENDDQPKQTYTLRPLTPLAFERHVTVEEGKRSPYTPSPRERSYKLLPKDVLFCSYMIDTYGEDYEGMTKDAKNVYRENARSLQRKMRVFKESPHFDTYKKHQETGRSVEEILQEEATAQA
ncbi:unnamed protein product, partial [Mesorhabditis belari]|uniref:Uncharacterized protein n=1 Tax=Mesorhabditis belari TaxID=2138241 RepID=A0AAF3FLS3_9BILA